MAQPVWATKWPTERLAYLFEPRIETGQPALDVLSVYRDYGVIPKSSRDDNFNRTPADLSRYQVVHPGDVVVNRMKAWQGSLGVSAFQGLVSPDYDVLRPTTPQWDMRFLHHVLRSRPMVCEYAIRSTGIRPSQWRLYWTQLRMIDVPVPEVSEQRAIADCLDRETARIDTLIAEQEQLIELLRERRQAAITRSTTGSDLERIPLVRCMAEQVDYRGATPTKTDSGVQLVTARNVKSGWIDYESSKEFIAPSDYERVMRRGLPRTNDLLFTMEAPLGNVALVDREDIALAQRVIKWTVDRDRAVPRYLLYAILGDELQFQLRARATGSTALGIKASKLPGLQVSLPSLEEQQRIAAYLDEQTAKIDALITETEKFIELAQERRSALITAAVTGQLDIAAKLAG